MKTYINRVIVWDRPDGGVSITHLHENDMLEGESEDDFISRFINKLKLSSDFSGFSESIISSDEIPSNYEKRDKWKLVNGKVEIDDSIKTKRELNDEKKIALRGKLKKGQPLTDEDIDLLL